MASDSAVPDYDPDIILADPDAHPIHKVYAAINIGIRDRGERWAKCPNCGDPYQLTEQWGNTTVCSERCGREYAAYVMGDGRLLWPDCLGYVSLPSRRYEIHDADD